MTITIALSATVLLAIWLLLMGAEQMGAAYPRWVKLIMGGMAILAGVLMLISGLGG